MIIELTKHAGDHSFYLNTDFIVEFSRNSKTYIGDVTHTFTFTTITLNQEDHDMARTINVVETPEYIKCLCNDSQ